MLAGNGSDVDVVEVAGRRPSGRVFRASQPTRDGRDHLPEGGRDECFVVIAEIPLLLVGTVRREHDPGEVGVGPDVPGLWAGDTAHWGPWPPARARANKSPGCAATSSSRTVARVSLMTPFARST